MTTHQSLIHRSLANYDVLCTIFDTMRPNKADLRSAALVCRTFKEPALRSLWRKLTTSTPLYHLLAPEALAFPNHISEAYLDSIIAAELHKDPQRWESFRWYTQRVRYLKLGCHNDQVGTALRSKHEMIIRTVLAHLDGRTMFPALRTISCDLDIAPLFDRICTAVHKASFISMHPLDAEPPSFMALLQILRTRSTHLRKLRIGNGILWDPPLDLSHLVHELSAFRNLRYISLNGMVTPSAFFTLVTMPSLEDMRVTCTNAIVSDGISVPPGPILASSRLRMLSLRGSCAAITEVMNILRTEQLTALHLHVHYPDPELSDYTSCFEAAAQALLTPQTLKKFFVSLNAEGEEWQALLLSDIFYPMFEPLRQTSFAFCLDVVGLIFATDDDDLLEMALGWPKITLFEVMIQWDEDAVLPTPAVLHHFWQHCPDLKYLALPYLDLTAESTQVPTPPEESHHGLRRLQVSYIPDVFEAQLNEDTAVSRDDIERWAHYIACLFPNATPERFYQPIPGRLSWGSVFEHLFPLGSCTAPSGTGHFSDDEGDMYVDGFDSDED